jgi:hypothetical protein
VGIQIGEIESERKRPVSTRGWRTTRVIQKQFPWKANLTNSEFIYEYAKANRVLLIEGVVNSGLFLSPDVLGN